MKAMRNKIGIVMAVTLLAVGPVLAQEPEDGFVFGVGAQATVWDSEVHGTYEGDWSGVDTRPTGGAQVLAGYRFNRFFELGLKMSLAFPQQVEQDTAILFRLLPQAKLILPVQDWAVYWMLGAGYSYFRDAAYYQQSESHGAVIGAGLGAEFEIDEGVRMFFEAEYQYQFDSEIGDNHGFLRYDNVNLTVGILF